MAFGFESSYWVWQREEPLGQEELTQLASQGVRTIYWHVGELENIGDNWRWKARFSKPPNASVRFVPVVRLVSREPEPFSAASTAALVAALTATAKLTGELQVDYDAPDRLLEAYGSALGKIHETVSRLTITALPHWSRPDCLRSLAKSADELFPMLYDFEAEPVLQKDSPQPLLAPEKMAKMLNDWSTCPMPWSAGLPVFARLSVYDERGQSRGQIRNWTWDEVGLNRAFLSISKTIMGATVLRAQTSFAISNTRLQAGDQLVVRLTDRAALRDAINTARQAGARGVTLFRLPDSTASSGWSLLQLAQLDEKPHLILRKALSNDSLTLENDSAADLAPRFESKEDGERGYAVEITTDAPLFREAEAGDFAGVTSYKESAGGGQRVALPFATRLAFTFSHLRAKQVLKTGLIQLAPGSAFRHARYRFRNIEGDWKLIE